jgi:hypothetical protein
LDLWSISVCSIVRSAEWGFRGWEAAMKWYADVELSFAFSAESVGVISIPSTQINIAQTIKNIGRNTRKEDW